MTKYAVAIYWGRASDDRAPDSIITVSVSDRSIVAETVKAYVSTFNSGVSVPYQMQILGEIDAEI